MITTPSKKTIHNKRVARIRTIVKGTAVRPRLSVFRSNRALIVQLIDDAAHTTLFGFRANGKNTASAKDVGKRVVEMLKKKHIKEVVFDRGGYKYHGGIKALADTLREGGMTV